MLWFISLPEVLAKPYGRGYGAALVAVAVTGSVCVDTTRTDSGGHTVSPTAVFVLVSLVTLAVLAATLRVLRPRLRSMLVELCGSEARAEFWVTVGTWWVGIIGVLAGTVNHGYALGGSPADAHLLGAVMTQLRTFLAGLLGAILVLALGLPRWIRREEPRPAAVVRRELPSAPRLSGRPPAQPGAGAWPVS